MRFMRQLVLAAGLALALAPVARAQEVFVDEKGVANRGYDVVAYFTDGKAVQGTDQFSATFEGNRYLFATAEHRDAFKAAPARFLPAYGGYCAYGVAKGGKFPTDPLAFRVVDGKLYLNKNPKVQELWLKDIPGNIADAEKQWPTVRAQPVR